MSSIKRRLLLAFALTGLAASATSTYVHYQLLTQPSYNSFCDVNPGVSCTAAYLSPYGSLFGIPVAVGGVFYFAIVLLLARLIGREGTTAAEGAPGYVFALSTVALAVVLYLGWASYFVLKIFCVLCATTYVAVIGIFIVTGAVPFRMASLPRRAADDARLLLKSRAGLLIVVLFAGAAATVVLAFPSERAGSTAEANTVRTYPPLSEQQRAELERWWAVQPVTELPVERGGAKVLIVKFSDFQCPACKDAYDAYKGVLAKYRPDQVKHVVKHFPLEPECNVSAGNHFAACEAAAAMVMADATGQAGTIEAWLYRNQSSLTPASVKEAARDVVGIADFDARYPAAVEQVRADASLGATLKIEATPTYFVNGRRFNRVIPPQYLEGLIEIELRK